MAQGSEERVGRQSIELAKRVALKILKDADDAADAVQEARVKLHKAKLRGDGSAEAYFLRVVTRCALDALRLRRRSQTRTVELQDFDGWLQYAAPTDGGIQAVIDRCEIEQVLSVMAPEVRERYRLFDLGFGWCEIAQLQGMNRVTMRTNTRRARLDLLKRLRSLN